MPIIVAISIDTSAIQQPPRMKANIMPHGKRGGPGKPRTTSLNENHIHSKLLMDFQEVHGETEVLLVRTPESQKSRAHVNERKGIVSTLTGGSRKKYPRRGGGLEWFPLPGPLGEGRRYRFMFTSSWSTSALVVMTFEFA
jgi:hypothetical protein